MPDALSQGFVCVANTYEVLRCRGGCPDSVSRGDAPGWEIEPLQGFSLCYFPPHDCSTPSALVMSGMFTGGCAAGYANSATCGAVRFRADGLVVCCSPADSFLTGVANAMPGHPDCKSGRESRGDAPGLGSVHHRRCWRGRYFSRLLQPCRFILNGRCKRRSGASSLQTTTR